MDSGGIPRRGRPIFDRGPTTVLASTVIQEGSVQSPDPEWLEGATKVEQDGRYMTKGVAGRGRSAEIRILHDKRIGRDVAAKFVDGAEARVQQRFLREAWIQGQLEHPSIVPVYDVGKTAAGELYFTMKHIRGVTLESLLEGLRAEDAVLQATHSRSHLLRALRSVCLAVAFSHDRGVTHGNLSPANIMIAESGEAYVLDWGMAGCLGDARTMTLPRADSQVAPATLPETGSPGYMAPEQLREPNSEHSTLVDVYALGALLFEVLTLLPLHPGVTRRDLIESTLAGAEARPSKRAPHQGVPLELEAICVRATSTDPAARFVSVREMHDALERFSETDRDLELRRTVSKHHLRMAEAAIADGERAPLAEEEEHRSRALHELGRALVLDPRNIRVVKRVMFLLSSPPRRVPREANQEVSRLREGLAKIGSSWSAMVHAAIFSSIPPILVMGVREWPSFLALYGAAALSAVMSFRLFRSDRPKRLHRYLSLAASAVVVAFSARIFGPLFLLPTLLLATVVARVLYSGGIQRKMLLALGLVATALPPLLEGLGAIGPSYAFKGGMMCILPGMVELPKTATMVLLFQLNVALVFLSGSLLSHTRTELLSDQENLHVYAWQLRQLIAPPPPPKS